MFAINWKALIRGRTDHFSNIRFSCNRELLPMFLTFELDLDIVVLNQHARYQA